MIYLIESAAFKEVEGKREYFSILKIGYTGDNESTMNSRFGAYRLHNPTMKILYTISGLTIEEEGRIQKKFREYIFPDYGAEWFYYNDDIVKFFESLSKMNKEEINNTIKEIIVNTDKSLDSILDLEEKKFIYDNRSKVRLVLARILSTSECSRISEINSILINSYENGYKDFSGFLDYIKKRYGEEVVKEYEKRMEVLNANLENKRIVEMYHESTTQVNKLKVLCENEINDTILSNIPDNDELKPYFIVLGPEKIKATGYDITDIRKAFNKRTFCDVEMYKEVFENSNFQIGSKIEKTKIKDYFRNLYSKYGYKGAPKAIDIGNYFNIKSTLISIVEKGIKKRVNGFEILGFNIESPYYKEYLDFLNKEKDLID